MSYPAFNHGPLRQNYPRVQFTRGYDPMGARNRQAVAPVKSGETIKSGMCACLVYNSVTQQEEWVAGLTAGRQPFVIIQEPSDMDTQGNGAFVAGISLSDPISFETAHVTVGTAADWDTGAAVTAEAAGTPGTSGKFKLATTGNRILGYLAEGHINGLIDRAYQHFEVTRDGNGQVLVAHIGAAYVPGNLAA